MTESNVLTQEENLRENRAVEAGTYEEKVLVRVENLRKYFPVKAGVKKNYVQGEI